MFKISNMLTFNPW